jgi:hypothetical protein
MSWTPVWIILGIAAAFVVLAVGLAVLERGGDPQADERETREREREAGDDE